MQIAAERASEVRDLLARTLDEQADQIELARKLGARSLFLEVRPSNRAAQALYTRFGFRKVAVRRGYYPAHTGREDALVLTLPLP